MPLLALAKQRLDPYPTLGKRLLIGEGLLIGFHAFQGVCTLGTMDKPTPGVWGALDFHWADLTDRRIGTILHLLFLLQVVRRT